jgi:hypothetical protein
METLIKELRKRVEKIELQVGIKHKTWTPTRKKVKGKNGKVN